MYYIFPPEENFLPLLLFNAPFHGALKLRGEGTQRTFCGYDGASL
jgi:hypothetical protein